MIDGAAEYESWFAVHVRRFRLWSYDVWGNAEDGYDVNDRSSHGTVEIECARERFNVGTAREFSTWEPTDAQLCEAAGLDPSDTEWEGDSGTYYATRESDGYPLGELNEREAE